MKIALFVLLGFVGVLVVGVIIAGPQLQQTLTSLAPRPPKTTVRTEVITKGSLKETVKAPGKIEPHTKVDISAQISARIEELPFEEGHRVTRGDIVVKLDDRDLNAALAASEARRDGEMFRLQSEGASLTGLLSSLSFARKELDRKQMLYDSGDLPRKDLDESQERVNDLEARVEAAKFTISVIESTVAGAKADIDRAKESLAKTVIAAPMDGLITQLNAEVGEVVIVGTMNNAGTVILTIADLSRMILNAEVSESDIVKIAVNQPARIHINAYSDEVFSGTVTQIALQRTENMDGTGYFKAEIEIDLRGQQILSGLIANADIEIASHDGFTVESQAIVDRPTEELPDDILRNNPLIDRSKKTTTVVYRVIDGKAVCTPVRRGASDDTHSIVEVGLDENDVVIIGPFKVLEKIKHGDAVMDEKDSKSEDEPADQTAETDAEEDNSSDRGSP